LEGERSAVKEATLLSIPETEVSIFIDVAIFLVVFSKDNVSSQDRKKEGKCNKKPSSGLF